MRILVALSGGVDSAVAAARLLGEGAEVIAAHLHTGVEGNAAQRDARQIAARLGVPLHVIDVEDVFARVVVDDFIETYARGRTPNPCVTCNAIVKFARLGEIAETLGCEAVGTGHYARTEPGPGVRQRLLCARDRDRDQSYVLYRLEQAQLARACLPLGSCRKHEVRAEARDLGLDVAAKPDSQDLCFVPRGDYRLFLRERAPEALVPGEIVDDDGRVVGRHDGAAAFTVGQRRGLPAMGRPRYVAHVDGVSGRVSVTSRDGVRRRNVAVGACNWIEVVEPPAGHRFVVTARIRHASAPVPAVLESRGHGRAYVCFEEPVFAPTPGQALVAYVGEAVLCGGTILETRADASGGPIG